MGQPRNLYSIVDRSSRLLSLTYSDLLCYLPILLFAGCCRGRATRLWILRKHGATPPLPHMPPQCVEEIFTFPWHADQSKMLGMRVWVQTVVVQNMSYIMYFCMCPMLLFIHILQLSVTCKCLPFLMKITNILPIIISVGPEVLRLIL